MKRILAVLLCIATLLCVPFTRGSTRAALVDSLAEKELTVAQKEALLNAEPLTPVKTGYPPLDDLVEEILGRIITPGMTNFDKVCAIYGYLMKDGVYKRPNGVSEELYDTIGETVQYNTFMDRSVVCEAYGLLVTKIGDCLNYASACMVLARAIGLEAYVISCGNSTAYSGSGNHFASLFRLGDGYYIFDPVMGVVSSATDVISGSEFFCKPFASDYSRAFCNLPEMLTDYGGFRQGSVPGGNTNETFPAAAPERYFTLGSYPQSEVTDAALLKRLNAAIKPADYRSCGYSCGNGEPGSQTVSDYMRIADVELEGERYRAVTFSAYRPTYSYYPQNKTYSYQDDNGYEPNKVYWFRYEPVEWRLLDEGNLLLCDLVLDSQPFNAAVFPAVNGKTLNGKTYYLFADRALTVPADSWSDSSVRRWLNSDFYDTAFTEEEKALIAETALKNYGCFDRFSAGDSVDKVFLLSYNDVTCSGYAIAQDNASRANARATDYACVQGVSLKRDDKSLGAPWLLRSPGFHSEDVCMVSPAGHVYYHYDPAVTHNGIRPAIRLKDSAALTPETLTAPRQVKASATATGQLTVKASAVNGAEGYVFRRYRADTGKQDGTAESVSPALVDQGLTPGVKYYYTVAAYRTAAGKRELSAETASAAALCQAFVAVPTGLEGAPAGTGAVALKWNPVKGAAKYRIYRYADAETLAFCAETDAPSCTIENLRVDSAHYFTVTAVSADGWESAVSPYPAVCVSRSYPARPSDVTAAPTATGEITVRWTKVPEAARYRIYRYTSATQTKLLGETENGSFKVTGLLAGVTYAFVVTAETADGKSVSSNSLTVRATCESFPPVPGNVQAEAVATGSIRLTWTGSKDAARYKVYRYKNATDVILLGETTKTELTVTGLVPGVEYAFCVTAESADGKDVSARSDTLRAFCKSVPAEPQNAAVYTSAKGTLTLLWTGSADAASYRIYRYVSATDTKLIGETAQQTFTVPDLWEGSTYVFRLVAVAADGKRESAPVILRGTVAAKPEKAPYVPQIAPQAVRRGDVDMNGEITAGDARLALRCAVGLETYEAGSPAYLACDVDGTPGVTAADARLILRAAVGLEDLN